MPASSHSRVLVSQAELTSVNPAVPIELGSGVLPTRPRAKAIARPERVLSARIFKAACKASGLSNQQIARWLGVDERRVREMQDGEDPVRLEGMVQLPPSLEAGLGYALIEHAKSRAIVMPRSAT